MTIQRAFLGGFALLLYTGCGNTIPPATSDATPTATVTAGPATAAPATTSAAPSASSGPAPTAKATGQCQNDSDCACGVSRSTGACAVGLASEIDTTKQCPDFCSGVAGHLEPVCRDKRCTQAVRKH